MEEQSVATEFSVTSRLPFNQLLEPAERGRSSIQTYQRRQELLGTQSLAELKKLAGLTVRFKLFWC